MYDFLSPGIMSGQRTCTWLLLLLCSSMLVPRSLSAAEQEIPITPAGQVLSAWLDAYNSGDPVRIEAYCKTHDSRIPTQQMVSFRKTMGEFDLLGIERSEPLSIEFLLRQRTSGQQAIGKFDVTNSNPPQESNAVLLLILSHASIVGFSIDATTRSRVVDAAIAALNDAYVFPEVAKNMGKKVHGYLKAGKYDSVSDGASFAKLLTADFQEVSRDKHLNIYFSPAGFADDRAKVDAAVVERERTELQRINCGFNKMEWLAGNVGYLRLDIFSDPAICGETAISAMNLLANVDAIIFDLRENSGGDPGMVALISTYLFSSSTHLNDLWERKSRQTRQFWTLPYVPGKRLSNAQVYVLTSNRTFSGAEEFSYNLQVLERATIVGEVTGGGAHPVTSRRIDDRFMLAVPYAQAINPLTKTNWEGAGVEPDLKIPASEALEAAQKLALKELIKSNP